MHMIKTGALFAGRFRVERAAGAGGMGIVYRAIDEQTGMPVALKVMSPKRVPNLERFHREAMLVRDLRHPAIVRYVAHGTSPAEWPFLAMEWVEGKTLAETLQGASLHIGASLHLALGVARALLVAHHRGVVHRDIKPSNIMLERGRVESVKIVDFGIARDPLDPTSLTRPGAVLGTPGYRAPEQAGGDRDVDARADVFSLGCVLFECLTGRAAFSDRDLSGYEPPPPSRIRIDVPLAVDTLVRRMLSKHPSARPADGGAVATQIGAILGALESDVAGGPVSAPAALTLNEMKPITVVVASRTGDDTAPPFGNADDDSAQSLDRALQPLELVRERLADGMTICTLQGRIGVEDQATRAARCALILRAHLPDATIAVAMGQGTLAGSIPVGNVVDRALSMLRQSVRHPARSLHPSWIAVDDLTAELLGTAVNVRAFEDGLFLVA